MIVLIFAWQISSEEPIIHELFVHHGSVPVDSLWKCLAAAFLSFEVSAMSCVGVFRHESHAKADSLFLFYFFFPPDILGSFKKNKKGKKKRKQPSIFPDFFFS